MSFLTKPFKLPGLLGLMDEQRKTPAQRIIFIAFLISLGLAIVQTLTLPWTELWQVGVLTLLVIILEIPELLFRRARLRQSREELQELHIQMIVAREMSNILDVIVKAIHDHKDGKHE